MIGIIINALTSMISDKLGSYGYIWLNLRAKKFV